MLFSVHWDEQTTSEKPQLTSSAGEEMQIAVAIPHGSSFRNIQSGKTTEDPARSN
jgi:hypothetical protein